MLAAAQLNCPFDGPEVGALVELPFGAKAFGITPALLAVAVFFLLGKLTKGYPVLAVSKSSLS